MPDVHHVRERALLKPNSEDHELSKLVMQITSTDLVALDKVVRACKHENMSLKVKLLACHNVLLRMRNAVEEVKRCL